MRGSYSASGGLPHPLVIGALVLIAMATFFGDSATSLFGGQRADQMERIAGLDDAMAPDEPLQEALDAAPRPLMDPAYQATPTHSFVVEALVLSRKAYRFDSGGAVSPIDLMLGWGPMSNPAVVSEIGMRQSRRFGYVSTGPDSEVDLDAVSPYWTNAHLIPASAGIETAIEGLAPGQVVRLEGALVNVNGPNGWRWETSTSRTDTGAGACEIILVTAVTVLR